MAGGDAPGARRLAAWRILSVRKDTIKGALSSSLPGINRRYVPPCAGRHRFEVGRCAVDSAAESEGDEPVGLVHLGLGVGELTSTAY